MSNNPHKIEQYEQWNIELHNYNVTFKESLTISRQRTKLHISLTIPNQAIRNHHFSKHQTFNLRSNRILHARATKDYSKARNCQKHIVKNDHTPKEIEHRKQNSIKRCSVDIY